MANRLLITFSSDFAVQSVGVGHMECAARNIAPDAVILHLMHGIPDYDRSAASLVMESVQKIQPAIHVCVVDPGVGTERKGIIIQAKRGDHFVGPDNGIFIHAVRKLGGAIKVVEITNPRYMNQSISPIFHGRDIFAPVAAYLATGIPMEEFGCELKSQALAEPPYGNAKMDRGKILARFIFTNKFGSKHLNIDESMWDLLGVKDGDTIGLACDGKHILMKFVRTFGDVEPGFPIILKDDYGRTQVSINQGNFTEKYGIIDGSLCILEKLSSA